MGVAYDMAGILNKHIEERFALHHLAYVWDVEEDGESTRWYVCKCNNKQSYDRRSFNQHQLEALKTVVL